MNKFSKEELSEIYRFMPNLPIRDLAYMAGLIDGEGYIALKRDHTAGCVTYAPVVRITNTSLEMLYWVQGRFGGYVGHNKMSGNGKWKESYYWTVHHAKAASFLSIILPYLVVKRKQAELVIQHYETNTPRKKPSEELALRRETIREELHKLNRRGPALDGPLTIHEQYKGED